MGRPGSKIYGRDRSSGYRCNSSFPVYYEQTLKSEMAKSEAPTLFQVNGPVGLASLEGLLLRSERQCSLQRFIQ